MKRRRLIIGILLVLFIGCATLMGSSRRLRAYVLCSLGMQRSALDPRIFVEAGIPSRWKPVVQECIDRAVLRIEEVHGVPFANEVRVCLCATQDSYNRRTGDPTEGIARGAVFANRVFLSPRCFETGTTEAILTHELSHLHLRQIMGTRYVTGVPGWFQEGLAVHVSRGGGAEPVTRQAAIAAIRQGRELDPEGAGAVIPRMANGHGLRHHMFYRQSEMFVEYLATNHAARFQDFLVELCNGGDFAEVFQDHFGGSPRDLWSAHRTSLL